MEGGGAASDGTFPLTSVAVAPPPVPASGGGAEGLEGLARARALHAQLNGVVATLNTKVGEVLAKQEREFLRAYRSHMYGLQRELQALRAKADDAALQVAKSEKIRSLEAERNWYRSEALRLDQFCSALKADVAFIRDKLSALDEDRCVGVGKTHGELRRSARRAAGAERARARDCAHLARFVGACAARACRDDTFASRQQLWNCC